MASSQEQSPNESQHRDIILNMVNQTQPYSQSDSPPYPLPSFSSLSRSIFEVDERSSLQNAASSAANNSLALQVQARDQTICSLRKEQDQLSRLYEQLVLKNKLVDRELELTQEEKVRLRKEAGILADQSDELKRENEQLRGRAQMENAQWQQILALASRLEIQSKEELRRFNVEREAWSREKADLEQRLRQTRLGCFCRTDHNLSLIALPDSRPTITLSDTTYDQFLHDQGASSAQTRPMNKSLDSGYKRT